MQKINSLEELKNQKEEIDKESLAIKNIIVVNIGMATCGIAAGAKDTYDALQSEIAKQGIPNVTLKKSGCMGSCFVEPTVEILLPNQKPLIFGNVTSDKIEEVLAVLKNGKAKADKPSKEPTSSSVCRCEELPFLAKQTKFALKNCGVIDPEKIDEYIALDGYQALGKVVSSMTPEEVLSTMKKSGLRGRGGGGFPTGLKWEFAYKNKSDIKYIICNADEGDPGAFMDRSILEGDPHSVLEAMAIAGFATNSNYGYIYIRAEYPLAVERLRIAISQATDLGLLGNNILGSSFSFHIDIRYGAGCWQ